MEGAGVEDTGVEDMMCWTWIPFRSIHHEQGWDPLSWKVNN